MEVRSEDRKKKLFRSKAARREIVEETLQPGTSVARIARSHGINANQVFAWRKLYREGFFNEESSNASNTLLPVKVSDSLQKPRSASPNNRRRKPGIIDIDLGHARVRIEGAVDPDCLRAALEGLIR